MTGQPDYPQYAELLEVARARAAGFVNPARLPVFEEVARRRGADWCTAVLGRPFSWVRRETVLSCELLVAADEAGVVPPLPASVVEARAAAAVRARRELDRLEAQAAGDAAAWAAALEGSAVARVLQVRANTRGRRTGPGGAFASPLRHAVPVMDLVSGTTGRPRLHVRGRAVCETPDRVRPRELGAPVEEPVTCRSCLRWVPKLRLA